MDVVQYTIFDGGVSPDPDPGTQLAQVGGVGDNSTNTSIAGPNNYSIRDVDAEFMRVTWNIDLGSANGGGRSEGQVKAFYSIDGNNWTQIAQGNAGRNPSGDSGFGQVILNCASFGLSSFEAGSGIPTNKSIWIKSEGWQSGMNRWPSIDVRLYVYA